MTKKIFFIKFNDTVRIEDRNNVLQRSHIRALRLEGFKRYHNNTDPNNVYVNNSPNDDLIVSICNYLKNARYEIIPDESIAIKLESFGKTIEDYERSKKQGLKIKKQKSVKRMQPPNFNPQIIIKPYQLKPIRHMIDVTHAANFSVPGSGKTLMTYAVYDILKQKGIVDSMLVIGPIASFSPWEQEYQFCMNQQFKNRIIRHHGTNRLHNIRNIIKYDVVLTSYETASNDLNDLNNHLMKKKKVMMVIDESHHIKNFQDDAKRATSMIELGKHAERRYILSGTPVPHSYRDLWSQITFLWPSIQILFTRDSFNKMLENNGGKQEITNRINFLWTRVTNKHLKRDMPRILPEQTIYIPMSNIQEEIYKAIERDMWNTIQQNSNSIDVFRLRKNRILRLLQAVTNPSVLMVKDELHDLKKFMSNNQELNSDIENYNDVSPKISKAAKIAVKIAQKNENVVVWTVFVKNVKMLCDEIKRLDNELDPIGISGDVPTESNDQKEIIGREELINQFKNSTGKIMVATVGSIAESISLHKTCHRAIYLERSFNAGQYMQSLSRIYRIGSDKRKSVKFIFLQSVFSDGKTETIDNRIDGVLKERIKQMHNLLDDEFELHPLELETISSNSLSSADDDENNIIIKETNDMIQKHREDNII